MSDNPDVPDWARDDETGRLDSDVLNVWLPGLLCLGGGGWLFFTVAHWLATAAAVTLLIVGGVPLVHAVVQKPPRVSYWWTVFSARLAQWVRDLRRIRVVFRITTTDPDVIDTVALKSRLFPSPPVNDDHRQTRDAFIHVVATKPLFGVRPDDPARIERDQRLLLAAQCVTPLEWHGDDPLRPLRTVRPVAPAASAPVVKAQSFMAAPVVAGLLGHRMWAFVAMGAAVLVVVLAVFNWVGGAEKAKLRGELEAARGAVAGWQDRAALSERTLEAQRKAFDEYEANQRKQAEESAKLLASQRARSARAATRQETRRADYANPVQPLDLDGRLRQLAEPAAAVPGVPAAPPADSGAAGVSGTGDAAPGDPR